MEKIQEYIASNPVWGGVLIIAIGLFLLLAAIFDWSFIFGDVNRSNYNPEKLDGIINLFGRKTARVVCGILSIVVIGAGILWIGVN